MMSAKLPSVLQGHVHESSISMERALKQILLLLSEIDPMVDSNFTDEDTVSASIDDVSMMLRHIDRD